VGFRFLLDSGLHVADAVTEAPAARDVDDAAPSSLVTAEAAWVGPPVVPHRESRVGPPIPGNLKSGMGTGMGIGGSVPSGWPAAF
jgi:hypothetical protein